MDIKRFVCGNCQRIIEVPYGIPKPETCPHCGAPANYIHRMDRGSGAGRRRRCGCDFIRE